MPIAAYTLDDGFDPSRVTPVKSLGGLQKPAGRRTVLPPAYRMTPTVSRPQDPATAQEGAELHNPRKRPFAAEDQSLPDIITHPPKKPRIHDTSIDSDQTFVRPAATATILEKQDDQKQNHFNIAAQSIVSLPLSSVAKPSQTLLRKSLRFAPCCRSPKSSAAFKLKKHYQPRSLKITICPPEQIIEPDSNQAKTSSPEYRLVEHIARTSTRFETAHTVLWTKLRESYTGSGPIAINIPDLLQAKEASIQAAIFTPNDSYQEKSFVCHGLHRPKA